MRFINNTKNPILLSVWGDNDTASSAVHFGDITIASGEFTNVYAANVTHVAFRAHNGSYEGNTLTPFINGIYTNGVSGYDNAIKNPTNITGTITVEYNDDSAEAANGMRWGLLLPTVDITGRKYQLNQHIAAQDLDGTFVVNATMESDGFSRSLPFSVGSYEYSEIRLLDDNDSFEYAFQFGTYGGGSSSYIRTFTYRNNRDAEYANMWTIHQYPGSPEDTPCSPPTIEITGGSAATDYGLWDWLETNGEIFKAETPTTITYNGNEIASLEAGRTATMSCSGKKAKSDIAIAFGAAGTITYNGTETAVEAGKMATLQCAGKKMTGDVYITVGIKTNAVKQT